MKSLVFLTAAAAAAATLAVSAASAGITDGNHLNTHRYGGSVKTTHAPKRSRRVAHSNFLPATGDWLTAVRVVQRVYPGSWSWLLSCSASEGGHGIWVWNGGAPATSRYHGSGAGGWMQYMEGTFWGDYHSAVRDLASRGVHVPRSSNSWFSALGQAVAAGWAYSHARWSGKWIGGGC